jgi:hypothetical protein
MRRIGVRLHGPQPSETDQGFSLMANRAARSQFPTGSSLLELLSSE